MNSLKISPVFRCLSKKLLILGFEIPELLFVTMLLGTCHLLFHELESRFWLTWIPPMTLCVALKILRRFKDEGFAVHWLKYQLTPGYYTAFLPMGLAVHNKGSKS
jgi:hypothetical protein